jgi:hypothetical protein
MVDVKFPHAGRRVGSALDRHPKTQSYHQYDARFRAPPSTARPAADRTADFTSTI